MRIPLCCFLLTVGVVVCTASCIRQTSESEETSLSMEGPVPNQKDTLTRLFANSTANMYRSFFRYVIDGADIATASDPIVEHFKEHLPTADSISKPDMSGFAALIESFHEQVETRTENKPFLDLAKAYQGAKQYELAERYYTIATEQPSAGTWHFWKRGLFYEAVGKYQEAVEDYTTAINLPKGKRFLYVRARVYHKLGQYKKAADDYLAMRNKDFRLDISFAIPRGYSLQLAGQHKEAQIEFNQAVRSEELPWYLYSRAQFWNTIQKPDWAINDYNKFLEEYPDFAPSLFGRAYAYFQKENQGAMCQDVIDACKLGLETSCQVKEMACL